MKRLRAKLPALLEDLESRGIREVGIGPSPPDIEERADELQVVRATQGDTEFPGSIYVLPDLPLEQTGGWVADDGDAVAEWVGDFLHARERADVRAKLANSGARETHAFVLVAPTSGVSFAVTDLLSRDGAPLPTFSPTLPGEITHAWVASGWSSGDGFRWSETDGWQRFVKLQRMPQPH